MGVSPFCTTMGLRRTGFAVRGRTVRRNLLRAAGRRVVEPGYPIEVPFRSLEDVRDYLSGDRLLCLRCGKTYRALGTHLRSIHGMTADDYRSLYNIPWTYALETPAVRSRRSSSLRRRDAIRVLQDPELRSEAIEKMRRTPQRRPNGLVLFESTKRILGTSSDHRWTASDFRRVCQSMVASDATAKEVCQLSGYPCLTWLKSFARSHAWARTLLEDSWESLSFASQSRAQRLGARFRVAVAEARLRGLTYSQISAELGVNRATVLRHVRAAGPPSKAGRQ
jgi:hypothetical protein